MDNEVIFSLESIVERRRESNARKLLRTSEQETNDRTTIYNVAATTSNRPPLARVFWIKTSEYRSRINFYNDSRVPRRSTLPDFGRKCLYIPCFQSLPLWIIYHYWSQKDRPCRPRYGWCRRVWCECLLSSIAGLDGVFVAGNNFKGQEFRHELLKRQWSCGDQLRHSNCWRHDRVSWT